MEKIKIGIAIDGVLRKTLEAFKYYYEKDFGKKISLDDIKDYNFFQLFDTTDELREFIFTDYNLEIFGGAQASTKIIFNELNNFYYENKDKLEITIFSVENGKTISSSLFFLSKNGLEIPNIKFFNEEENYFDKVIYIREQDSFLGKEKLKWGEDIKTFNEFLKELN